MEYLYTPRYCYISPLCFTAQRRIQVHDLAPCSQAGHPCSSAPPPPALGSSRSVLLDHHPIRNGGILDDDHNAVADDKAQVFLVRLLHVVVVHNELVASFANFPNTL